MLFYLLIMLAVSRQKQPDNFDEILKVIKHICENA